MKVRTRMAPSPTGIAHIGNMATALKNYALAKKHKGQFILRIEDTDRKRYVEGAVEAIYEAFDWLGLGIDEGPKEGGPYEPYTQSKRLKIYQDHAAELIKKDKAYYCFCSKDRLDKVRKDQQKTGKLPRYDGFCRNLEESVIQEKLESKEPHVIRLKVPDSGETYVQDILRGKITFHNNQIDDQVLLKSDGYPTYHLGVVVDDHLMNITHIIRGEEWLPSTPKHVLIYQAFGWELPIFSHVAVTRNRDRSKMSKRVGDVAVRSYIKKGYLPEAMINFLALNGWSHPDKEEIFSLKEYVQAFTLERLQATAPVFDTDKLNWLNGIYIRELSDTELLERLKDFIPKGCSNNLAKKIIPLIKERLVTLGDFEELSNFFYQDISYDKKLLLKKGAMEDMVKQQLTTTREKLSSIDENNWTHENIEQEIRSISQENDWKPGQYFMMLRIAATGKKATPPLFETIEVIGKQKTLERFQ